MKKSIYISLIVLFSVCIACLRFEKRVDEKEARRQFANDQLALNCIAHFMIAQDEEALCYDLLTSEEKLIVSDDSARESLEQLKENGYKIITKEDGMINFLIWSNKDMGIGIVYSEFGTEPKLQFQTYCSLLEEKWYYYEEDYNQWRLHNVK